MNRRAVFSGLARAAAPLALAAYFAAELADIGDGARGFSYEWVPALGIEFALRLDGLSLLFAVLISGIGALVFMYSASYMSHHAARGRFYILLYLFMGAMLGLVLADNLITLIVFWELTSITSYGLISLESQRESARSAALQALFVTGAGGLALLAGFVLLGQAAGTYQISELVAGGSLADDDLYLPILALVLLGAFTKSAQVPFHFWLPNAMEAPTPVSAYLHSATMVKAGVYLLARLMPVLGDSDEWFYAVSGIGAATMLTGAVLALAQTDLKRILAYSTLSILGSLVFLLGIGTHDTVVAAMVLLVAHACYKAALFLAAGIIDHETGTRDIRELGGLMRAMPVTAACVILAGLSMAGIPVMFGFIAKESVYEALLHADRLETLLLGAAVLANLLMVAVALILIIQPFFGPKRAFDRHVHEADVWMLAGPVVLCFASVLLTFMPARVDSSLFGDATGQITGEFAAKVSLWHGFNTALALSGLTAGLGLAAYLSRNHLATVLSRGASGAVSPEQSYNRIMTALAKAAESITKLIQNGYLRLYFSVLLAAAVLLIAGTGLAKSDFALPDFSPAPRIEELGVALVTLAGALMAVGARSRIIAIIGLGLAGYGVALVYAMFGAPDLAMTQILVETLTVLLLLFAFYRLPRFAVYSRIGTRARDALLSIAAGTTISILLLTTLTVDQDRTLSQRLSEISKPEAYGSNVVNVILVDFRALDTLGEITVLAAAAVGIISLLRMRRRRSGE